MSGASGRGGGYPPDDVQRGVIAPQGFRSAGWAFRVADERVPGLAEARVEVGGPADDDDGSGSVAPGLDPAIVALLEELRSPGADLPGDSR